MRVTLSQPLLFPALARLVAAVPAEVVAAVEVS